MGIFKKLFKKEELQNPIDFSVLEADFHSHLLPGIDDGVQSLEDSVRFIEQMKELGFKKLITTPHIMSEFYKNDPKIIKQKHEAVANELIKRNIDIVFEAAAEYLVDEHFFSLVKKKDILTFGDQYVLVEFPFFSLPMKWKEIFFDLQIAGYKVILAHPERYGFWHNDPEKYFDLKDKGVFLQINTISLTGYYDEKPKEIAGELIDNNLVDFVGSDLHNDTYFQALLNARYKPKLKKLIDSGKLLNPSLL